MLDKAKNTGVPRRYLRNPNVKWFDVDLSDLQEILVEEKEIHKYELQYGDVIICEGGEAGRAAFWKEEEEGIIFQKACHRVRVGPKLDARFLIHRLMFDYFNGGLEDYYTGATIKHFTGQDLARYEIPLPPIEEQQRIVAALGYADALRRKRKRANDLLDKLIRSNFLEMFGGAIGRDIPSVSLRDICNKITDGTHQSPKWADRGVPFLFVSNIRRQYISFDTKNFVSESEYEKLTKHSPIEAGDVLYTAVGSYGNTAVVPPDRKFVFQRHIAHLKPKRGRVNSQYLSIVLEMPDAKWQADRYARGVAQKTVTLASLKEMTIPLPTIEMQGEFAARVDAIQRQIDLSTKYVHQNDTLFSSLQSRAFSGQL
jgi:type I restriction enzyme S subunit